MLCKHQYYNYDNGTLRCTQCNQTAEEIKGSGAIEDKIGERTEVKGHIMEPKSKRITRKKKAGRKHEQLTG